MRDLFIAELLRFRLWAGLYALAQLLVLGFLTRVVDLAQQPGEVYLLIAAVHGLAGLLLGLYQFGGYRKPNAWLNLLHRPLAPARIALALLGAGAVLLAIGAGLPMFIIAGWQETMTPRVLDMRHLWLCLAGVNIAVIGYLSGACATLLPRRSALAALLFLFLLPGAGASGTAAILLQTLVIAWLLAMVLAAFKPDLGTAPRGVRILWVALPLQVMLWIGGVGIGFGVELLWIAQGSHPNNLPMPPPGSAKEADQADGRDLLIAGLDASTVPDSALWKEQAAISDIATFGPNLREIPAWHELTNRAPMEFDDDTRRIRWVFSHDSGRFEGHRLADEQPVAELGIDGQGAFPWPPLPMGDGLLAGRDAVWQYDSEAMRVRPRLHVPEGEVIAGIDTFGERLVLLTNRAVYFHDARALGLDDAIVPAQQRLPLPYAIGNLTRVDVLELIDGHLVSFTVTVARHNGNGPAFQQVQKIGADGQVEDVARRALETGYGPLFTWQTWILSPAIHASLDAAARFMAPYQPINDLDPPRKPAVVRWAAGGLLLLSLLFAMWHVRRTDLAWPARVAWCIGCGLAGLPALGALWLMAPPRERLDDLPSLQAATA